VVGRWLGYSKPDPWIQRLTSALEDPTTIDQKRARYEAKPTAVDAEKLAVYHESRDEAKDAVRYWGEAQKLAAGTGRDFRYPLFDAMAGGVFKDVFTLAEAKQAADAALAYEAGTVDEVLDIAGTMTVLGRKKQDREVMQPYLVLAMAKSKNSQDEDILKSRNRLAAYHALYVEKDAAKAVALRKEVLEEGWQKDPKKLNAFAWWCFEGRVNLEEAQALALQGVELAQDGKTKAQILDTAAEICNARGNCPDAVKYMEMAVTTDPKSEEYPKKLEQFRKNLATR